tara:strand:+ start:191 stop:742 length:552 start_codon:yes stop_codon:yes gene_type:complete
MAEAAAEDTGAGALAFLDHHHGYSDALIRKVLSGTRTIAMVGASTNWKRPSYFVMKYLQKKGYRVIPVNPGSAGQTLLGETVHASLAEIPDRFDMVDVFRSSEAALGVTQDVLACQADKGIDTIWMQLTVRNDHAARLAEDAGLTVVMNRCPKIEYARLAGELGWSGINTGIISAKSLRPPRS